VLLYCTETVNNSLALPSPHRFFAFGVVVLVEMNPALFESVSPHCLFPNPTKLGFMHHREQNDHETPSLASQVHFSLFFCTISSPSQYPEFSGG
jgi:hypothetical protein